MHRSQPACHQGQQPPRRSRPCAATGYRIRTCRNANPASAGNQRSVVPESAYAMRSLQPKRGTMTTAAIITTIADLMRTPWQRAIDSSASILASTHPVDKLARSQPSHKVCSNAGANLGRRVTKSARFTAGRTARTGARYASRANQTKAEPIKARMTTTTNRMPAENGFPCGLSGRLDIKEASRRQQSRCFHSGPFSPISEVGPAHGHALLQQAHRGRRRHKVHAARLDCLRAGSGLLCAHPARPTGLDVAACCSRRERQSI